MEIIEPLKMLIETLLENKLVWVLIAILLISYVLKIVRFFIERNKNYELKEIDLMSGQDFEYCFANILRKSDHKKVKVTQYQGDQGIDILASKDRRNIGYQCKRYKKNVGNKAVQEAHAGKSYYGLAEVYVVTNSYFTKSAI
ncbi:restriction endonuclease [Carnobacterium maltaromaticum]|uniref:restriction endonuclease n=1 Tax=Carnobacterium maltaromaticum TaxID=2751 RepID=UPI001F41CBF6|nr:restriction endonuclease [Carnobacterium maltaromaticum]